MKSDKKKGEGPMQREETLRNVSGWEQWDETKLAAYFAEAGLGDYEEMLVRHKITGRLAPLLTDLDLKEMGVDVVGDRLRFRLLIQSFGRKARMEERSKTIWSGKEKLHYGCLDACYSTCCGLCPDDPSEYKLSRNHLLVKKVEPARCGPCVLCCCHKYSMNNYDLTHVTDVDVMGRSAPCVQQVCCCAEGMDVISITGSDGDIIISLSQGEGEQVSRLILNQIEEAQVMERD